MKKMFQMFHEVGQECIHYLSNFAEVLNAEKPAIEELKGWIIKDVEIFKAGTYRGITYTEQDLDDMVLNFQTLKQDGKLEPIFKVNHSEDVRDQVGWILDVKKSGDLLLADIHITDWMTMDKIRDETWKNVSAEIYTPELAKEEFGIESYVLRAVAVVSIPKVKDIKGIVLNSERWDDWASKNQPKGGDSKVDKLLQLLSELGITLTDEQQAQLLKKGVSLFAENSGGNGGNGNGQQINITAAQIVALSEQFTTLEKDNKDLSVQVATLLQGSKKAEIEKWVQQFSEQGKILPAERESIIALAEKLEGESLEAYKNTIEARPSIVQLGESGAHQNTEEDDELDKTYSAFSEQFGQKRYE